ncbi:MAG: hypothetical protein JO001_03580 [Alphaproteobacteria bacterium]|nr:hypothetical protein [Alphaproteobacteria bacterium]
MFLIIAPVIGFPLDYPKNLGMVRIVSPVFLGYLGSATHFIFRNQTKRVNVSNEFLGLLVKGPLIIYALVVAASLAAFGYSNRASAEIGAGMSVDDLGTALSFALGVLAATTGVITSYLFVSPNNPRGEVNTNIQY